MLSIFQLLINYNIYYYNNTNNNNNNKCSEFECKCIPE